MLTQASILTYPDFSATAPPFVLQMDPSAVGLGAVLEQGGHVIAYASRTLTKSEYNYSVIQKECLAIIFGMKQFCHYLLGRAFTLMTDHAPLQWLSAQKMEGLLCRWALAMQEHSFNMYIAMVQKIPMLILCHITQFQIHKWVQLHSHSPSLMISKELN